MSVLICTLTLSAQERYVHIARWRKLIVLLLIYGIDYLGALDASGVLDALGLLYPVENGAWNLPMFSLTIP